MFKQQHPAQQTSAAKTAQRGFTLIELIMVIALMLILVVASAQSIISSTNQFRFQNVNDQILNLLREARSLAVSGKAQLDYTDFDKDILTDVPVNGQVDYVTPAHYGVRFIHDAEGDEPDKAILFIDNHSVAGEGSSEGAYDPRTKSVADYRRGYDIILREVTLPDNIRLSLENGTIDTIFYSPLYADISFSPLILDNFFNLGLSQSGAVRRERCYVIHKISGIPEPVSCQ